MKTWAIAAMLGGTLLLAGCKQHQEPSAENNAVEAPKPVVAPKPQPAPPPPDKPKTAAAPKAKPLPAAPEEQQVLDDADATGMTSRVDRSGTDTQAADTNREQ